MTDFRTWPPWFQAPSIPMTILRAWVVFITIYGTLSSEVRLSHVNYSQVPQSLYGPCHFSQSLANFSHTMASVTRTMEKLLTSPGVRELSRKAGEEVETAPTSFGLAFHTQWPWMPPFGANVIDSTSDFLHCSTIQRITCTQPRWLKGTCQLHSWISPCSVMKDKVISIRVRFPLRREQDS